MINRAIPLIFFLFLIAYSYQWPMFDQYGDPDNKIVTSGFCAYRPYYSGHEQHFHAGIDIPEQEFALFYGLYIWPIDYAQVVEIGGEHPNEWIKVRHYNYAGGQFTSAKDTGSVYRHANPCCEEGEWLTLDNPAAEGWDMYEPDNRHLHLEYRVPGSLADYKNPFSITELQIEDNDNPKLCSLYVDYTREGDAEVACWEYLGSNFTQYYSTISGGSYTFLQLDLQEGSSSDDWCDPHFIIAGNRKVRFVIKMYDANISAPYHYYLSVDTAIVDLAGLGYTSDNHYEVKFDMLYGSEYNQEEAVYHQEDPIVSDWYSQFYRLYPHGSTPSCVLKELTFQTENLTEEGQHRIRVTVEDYKGNKQTADVHFYIKMNTSTWVDYCRALTD